LDVLRTPDTYHSAGIRRGTATSNFHAQRDNLFNSIEARFRECSEEPMVNPFSSLPLYGAGWITWWTKSTTGRCWSLTSQPPVSVGHGFLKGLARVRLLDW